MTAVLDIHSGFDAVVGVRRGSDDSLTLPVPTPAARDRLAQALAAARRNDLDRALTELRAARAKTDRPLVGELHDGFVAALTEVVATDFLAPARNFVHSVLTDNRHHGVLWEQHNLPERGEAFQMTLHLWAGGRLGEEFPFRAHDNLSVACGRSLASLKPAQTGAWDGQLRTGSRPYDITRCAGCAAHASEFPEVRGQLLPNDLQAALDRRFFELTDEAIRRLVARSRKDIAADRAYRAAERAYKQALLEVCAGFAATPEGFTAIRGHDVGMALARLDLERKGADPDRPLTADRWAQLMKSRLPRSPYPSGGIDDLSFDRHKRRERWLEVAGHAVYLAARR